MRVFTAVPPFRQILFQSFSPSGKFSPDGCILQPQRPGNVFRLLIKEVIPLEDFPVRLTERIHGLMGNLSQLRQQDLLLRLMDEGLRERVRTFVDQRKQEFLSFLETNEFDLEFAVIGRDEFERFPAVLDLADLFLDLSIHYTYEQYLEHVEASKAFCAEHDGCTFSTLDGPPHWRNIRMLLCGDSWALISKAKAPAIHFIVENRELLDALRRIADGRSCQHTD